MIFRCRCLPSVLAACMIAIVLAATATAAELPKISDPLSPQQSLEQIELAPGLKAELVAHEPNVIDPVAIRFDEHGRLWVVEMRDYPTAETKGIVARSRISVLTDGDNDGFFESASVFADDLPYATGVQPWKGGVFVTIAGQVIYMKDTDGDGRADLKEVWYKGFAQGNTQLRANHPTLALDGHIYIANGLRGGTVIDAQDDDAKPVSISGMDFRFDPLTRQYEAVSGAGQFGLTFDDYGNRFVCSNRNPAMHVVLEDHHLKKNPLVAVSAVTTDVAKYGPDSRLYPIARSWTTSHLHAGQFTAACGVYVYRGNALPAEFYGNIYVCDPTAHLVQRQIMQPHGVTFKSRSAYKKSEFLASRDEWFSPVNLEIGADGAMYVVDMYRGVIEHPEWMPTELRKRKDLTLGNDRGRIYRIVPDDFQRPKPPQLSAASSDALVEQLAHANAWQRETAARLLLEREAKDAAAALREMALRHTSQLARIQALRLLEQLKALDDELITRLLADADPRIVEQAILAAENRLSRSDSLRERIGQLASHPDARVRFQALLIARPRPAPPAHPADPWELEAMLIAAGKHAGTILAAMLQNPEQLQANIKKPKEFIAALAHLAAASKNEQQQLAAITPLLQNRRYARAGLASLFAEQQRLVSEPADDIRTKLDEPTRRALERAFQDALAMAKNPKTQKADRLEAVDLLAFSPEAVETLRSLAQGDSPQPVRLRAIAALARQPAVEPWSALLANYASETPAVQRAILAGSLTSAERSRLFLAELLAGRIKPTEVDVNQAKQLLQTLFADALPKDREKALAEYQVVLKMKPDAARGRLVFQKHCATCHQVAGLGVAVGPDISDSRDKSFEQLLTDIIQPNRAIDSNFFSYTAISNDGIIHSGVLTAETSTSVTLKQAEGKEITLRRSEIDELRSDGVSFMPDGLEKNIPPQEMADLIGFIKHWRYLEEASEATAAAE